jgi:rhodanese-related sulfurtransferase
MQNISIKDFKNLLETEDKNFIVIDVRGKSEWDESHIQDERVINIDVNKLMFDTSKIDKSKTIYLICESGGRSSFAQMILGTKGFDCINVDGGMSAFRKL